MESVLCALRFNVNGMLLEILKLRLQREQDKKDVVNQEYTTHRLSFDILDNMSSLNPSVTELLHQREQEGKGSPR